MKRESKVRVSWALVPVMLVVLFAGMLPSVRGSVTTFASASPTSADVPAVAETALAETDVDDTQAAFALERRVIDVYDGTSPAVVNITNRMYVTYWRMGTVPEEGTGSGFLYDDQGHIVTNYHVIEDADELLVTLADGSVYAAEIVGSDPTNDLAVIRIDADDELPEPLIMGDSDELRVGQFVVAIGNPFGLDQTLTTGVVSALGRVIESPEDDRFIGEAIQTDAAINPGNSGGPLLDLNGRVIGVNSQIISPSGASSGVGFAVSASTVRRVVPDLITKGYYARPWLGADMIQLSASLVDVLRDSGADPGTEAGLLVLTTTDGGPADRAGVREADRRLRLGRYQLPVGGDVIVAIDNLPTEALQTLTLYLETERDIGDTVDLTIVRDGKEIVVSVVLAEQPEQLY